MTETAIVTHILIALRSLGYYVENIHGGAYQAAGIPDIVGCADGVFFGIEVKDPARVSYTAAERSAIAALRAAGVPCGSAGGCSKLQALHITRIRKAGGRAGVACGVEEALAVLTAGPRKANRR